MAAFSKQSVDSVFVDIIMSLSMFALALKSDSQCIRGGVSDSLVINFLLTVAVASERYEINIAWQAELEGYKPGFGYPPGYPPGSELPRWGPRRRVLVHVGFLR